ncbi:hypothetical protein CRG98_008435, partial [Punica granatum]
MEAVLQTKGLLSLPKNPRARVLNPSQGLKQRALSLKPKILPGFSVSSNGFRKFNGFVSNSSGK